MISHSTKIRSSRTRHMNAAAPQFGATGLVHLRDKDILTSVSRKFSGLPDEAARWFREITTFMDKHDLGPYKDNTVSVLVNDFHVVSDPHTLPDVPHAGWPGPTGPLPVPSTGKSGVNHWASKPTTNTKTSKPLHLCERECCQNFTGA